MAREEFEWADDLDNMLYDAAPVWGEEDDKGNLLKGSLMVMDMEDLGALSHYFGSRYGNEMYEAALSESPHVIICYVYKRRKESGWSMGWEFGKSNIAGKIPKGTRIDTVEDILSYVEAPRWEGKVIGKGQEGF